MGNAESSAFCSDNTCMQSVEVDSERDLPVPCRPLARSLACVVCRLASPRLFAPPRYARAPAASFPWRLCASGWRARFRVRSERKQKEVRTCPERAAEGL